MADRDGAAVVARDALELGEPRGDRGGGDLVVEEDVAAGVRHAVFASDFCPGAVRDGAAVDEEEPALAQLLHHGLERTGIAREPAAHVIVDADITIEPREVPAQALQHLVVADADVERARSRVQILAERLHGDMHQEFVPRLVRGLGLPRQIHRIGQERERQRGRQRDGARGPLPIESDIVNHH